MGEQRLHERQSVGFTVRLIQEGRTVVTARAVDISEHGLGIETPDIVLNCGQIIDVNFIKPGYPRGVSRCCTSMVVHSGAKRVGLMLLCDADSRFRSAV